MVCIVSMPLDDLEDVEIELALLSSFLADERMAGLVGEMRDIDHRQRISAFEHQRTADRHIAQGLFGAQHRLRAAQAAQVQYDVVCVGLVAHAAMNPLRQKPCYCDALSSTVNPKRCFCCTLGI